MSRKSPLARQAGRQSQTQAASIVFINCAPLFRVIIGRELWGEAYKESAIQPILRESAITDGHPQTTTAHHQPTKAYNATDCEAKPDYIIHVGHVALLYYVPVSEWLGIACQFKLDPTDFWEPPIKNSYSLLYLASQFSFIWTMNARQHSPSSDATR